MMKRCFKTLVLGGFTLAVTSTAYAQEINVPFAGLVTSTCLVTLGNPGVLAANATNSVLDSENGGTSGSAIITANGGGFRMTTITPTDFTLKGLDYNGSTTFASKYAASGASSGSGAAGTPLALSPGVTTAAIDLKATADSGVFSAGNYTATVTVRCEATGAGS